MPTHRHALLTLGTALLIATPSALSMSLDPVPLDQLVDEAHLVVHALVLTADSEPIEGNHSQLRTRHQLLVWEHLKAPTHRTTTQLHHGLELLEVLQPGGRLGSLETVVPGLVPLKPGDEVILLLTPTPWGLQPLGYPMGVFFVGRDGTITPAWPRHTLQHHDPTLRLEAVLRGPR